MTTSCPPWCRSRHEHGAIAHLGPARGGKVWARAVVDPAWPALRILIDAGQGDDSLFLTPGDATKLARLLGRAGNRELAEAIRRAVTDTEETGR